MRHCAYVGVIRVPDDISSDLSSSVLAVASKPVLCPRYYKMKSEGTIGVFLEYRSSGNQSDKLDSFNKYSSGAKGGSKPHLMPLLTFKL